MLIMHISQICSLISVFKNKIYETLIDKTLYECVLLITNLFSNILIFLQHLVISYITCLNTGTLVIKKYVHPDKCAHVCTNTHTHTYSPLITQLCTTFISIQGLLFSSVAFDTHHTSYSSQNKNTQYYQYWQHTHQRSTYCSVIDMFTFLKDFYICPIHVMKAQTRSRGTLVLHSFLFFHKSSLAYIISVPIPFHIPSLTSILQFTVRIMQTLKNHPGEIRVLNTLPLI